MRRGVVTQPRLTTSEKVLQAAAELLSAGGVEAVSTRAVAAAAGVQPPAIYRQFGDKEGLLDAVAQYVVRNYLRAKRQLATASDDPVVYLRQLWDLHIEFGLTHPHCYVLAYGQARPGKMASAATEAATILQEVIARVGDQGRLGMSVERATTLFQAAGMGMALTLIRVPPADRDPQLSLIARENALSAILNDDGQKLSTLSELPGRAVALHEALRGAEHVAMTPAERGLMAEWLNRLADQTRTEP
jgi:AcrR family transcriptional regulator